MIGGLAGAIGQGGMSNSSGPAAGGDTMMGGFDMGGHTINFGTGAGAGGGTGTAATLFGGSGISPVVLLGIAGVVGFALWSRSRK